MGGKMANTTFLVIIFLQEPESTVTFCVFFVSAKTEW